MSQSQTTPPTTLFGKLTSAGLWWSAASRSVYTFLAGGGFMFAIIGLTSTDQSQLITSVHQIGDGVSSILAGVTGLWILAAPFIAKFKSSPAQQAKALGSAAVPGVSVNVDSTAAPEIQAVAKTAPGVNMVPNVSADKQSGTGS